MSVSAASPPVLLSIEQELLSVDPGAGGWQEARSVALTRAFARGNVPVRMELVLAGSAYARVRQDRTLGWWGEGREYYNWETGEGWFEKSSLEGGYRVPFAPDWVGPPGELEEVDPPEIEYLDEFRQLLGLSCQRARWSDSESTWDLWVARGQAWPPAWQRLWGLPEVEGLVMEMTETAAAGQVYARRLRVVRVDSVDLSKGYFVPHPGFQLVAGGSAAREGHRQDLEQALSPPRKHACRASGPWQLVGYPDALYAWLTDSDGGCILHFQMPGGPVKRYQALPFREGVLAVASGDIRWFEWTQGRALQEKGRPWFRLERISDQELEAAGLSPD